MTRLLYRALFLISAASMLLISCSKEDNEDTGTNGKSTAQFNSSVTYGTMTDQEGNIYKTITVEGITFMAENLKTTVYRDGTPIQNIEGNSGWATPSGGAYCNYNNNNHADSIATFGRLYNWYAVSTGRLAPEGWHVATSIEWESLVELSSGVLLAGGRLKESGTAHWISPNEGAGNETGFTALPGGMRQDDGFFGGIGYSGMWWTSTTYNNFECMGWVMKYDEASANAFYASKESGFSVRCVKNQ